MRPSQTPPQDKSTTAAETSLVKYKGFYEYDQTKGAPSCRSVYLIPGQFNH